MNPMLPALSNFLSLRAGPLAMLFQPDAAFVRQICLGRREVLRGIYVAVRDRNWGTVPVQVKRLEQEVRAESFELSFEVECRSGGIDFRWQGQLSGAPDGTLRYTFDGEAVTTFLRNRIGFCVLHPLEECCNARAQFERGDGQRGEVRFPRLIEPQIVGRATFTNLRRLAYELEPGWWAELEFEGDVFETEDQRNWTDASFKTYCTPLALPFPVEIKAGFRLRQVITLRLKEPVGADGDAARLPRHRSVESGPVNEETEAQGMVLTIPMAPVGPMPSLGLGVASHGTPLNLQEAASLRSLKLNHLRTDVRFTDPSWPRVLSQAVTEAEQLGVALELAVHLGLDGSASALEKCGAQLKRIGVPLARILVFRQSESATSRETLRLARRYLDLTGVKLGGGTDAHFCELNREQAMGRFGLDEADCIAWPMTPQVHVFDDQSVMENLEAQPHTMATARSFARNKPLSISPITLRPRFNAAATGEAFLADPAQLPPEVDPRQLSMFNAAWTLGSIAGLAAANATSLTYFETTGWRGLMESSRASERHPFFSSFPGMVFPVYHLFAALAGFSQMTPVIQERAGGSPLAALCLFDSQRKRRVLCGNLTRRSLSLTLHLGMEEVALRTLELPTGHKDPSPPTPAWSLAAPRACSTGILRLVLPAYAIVSLDSSSQQS